MRHSPSPAEARLWPALSRGQLGVTFRRQVVLGNRYIADFLSREARLIIEVDGVQHLGNASADGRRDGFLAKLGYRTLRVTAADVDSRLKARESEQPGLMQ